MQQATANIASDGQQATKPFFAVSYTAISTYGLRPVPTKNRLTRVFLFMRTNSLFSSATSYIHHDPMFSIPRFITIIHRHVTCPLSFHGNPPVVDANVPSP